MSEMLANRSKNMHKRSEKTADASQLITTLGGRRASLGIGSGNGSSHGSRPNSARNSAPACGKRVMPVDPAVGVGASTVGKVPLNPSALISENGLTTTDDAA